MNNKLQDYVLNTPMRYTSGLANNMMSHCKSTREGIELLDKAIDELVKLQRTLIKAMARGE
jgi:hypothetical protein